MGTDQKFFNILAEGIFHPTNVVVTETEPGATLKRSPESEAYIERQWQAHLVRLEAAGDKPWPADLKPTRYRVADVTIEDGKLMVTLDPCVSYRDHIGSLTPEFEKLFGHDFVPNGLAVTNIIRTVDNKTIVTLRNSKTDYKPLGYHVSIGGFMDMRKKETVVKAMLRETGEETGITEAEIGEIMCLGAAYNPWQLHADLIFSTLTSLTARQVLDRKHDDENELFYIDTTPASYEKWMLDTMHANVIMSMVAMIFVGTNLWGGVWRARMLTALAEGSKYYEYEKIRLALEVCDIIKFNHLVALERAAR